MFDVPQPVPLPPFAAKWYAQIRQGYARLEVAKRDQLRAMTEADAARIFAQLDPARPYLLRPSSGLVEQQRLFHGRRTEDGEEGTEETGGKGLVEPRGGGV